MEERKRCRSFLKDTIRKEFDFSRADQNLGMPPPPIQKPVEGETEIIELITREDWSDTGRKNLSKVLKKRRSRRNFTNDPLNIEELSFLLWAIQGIDDRRRPFLRTSPSAGARHSLETYLAIGNVSGLSKGLYRYLPMENSLKLLEKEDSITRDVARSCFSQGFIAECAVVFIWTAVPYRMEWRYGPAAHKVIALDAGHVCQNLYLASESIGCGTCAIGAYDQDLMDDLLSVDGDEEFTIYLAPVGRIHEEIDED
jgi:SagB-type dehydrogenase family enzyme